MPSAFRRLAADQAVLHDDLPPNYLFAPDETFDDLTQLSILLAGPQGTPYSQGVWRLHLRMPEDYPKNPPKATFRTRIWHPNVEETTGAVCVDTLKRDWKTTLTLKDVLVTISCLLIYPNPDSALNSTAGALLQEDYEAFARQAKLMSSIHAPVPTDMKNSVTEAKLRGEDAGAVIHEQQDDSRSSRSRKGTRVQSVTMKKKPSSEQQDTTNQVGRASGASSSSRLTPQPHEASTYPDPQSDDDGDENDEDGENMPSKENDPSLSPSPVKMAPPPSPRKNALGKRPLSVLTMPLEHGPSSALPTSAGGYTPMDTDFPEEEEYDMTASEKNIAANSSNNSNNNITYPEEEGEDEDHQQPQRKSPKLSVLDRGTNSSGRIRDDTTTAAEEDVDNTIGIFEDAPPAPSRHTRLHRRAASGDGKENNRSGPKGSTTKSNRRVHAGATSGGLQPTAATNSLYPPSLAAPSASASASASAPTSAATSASGSPALTPSSVKTTARSKSANGTRKVSSSSSKQKPRIGIRRL